MELEIGQRVRFKSTGQYAEVHMRKHKGRIIGKGDPLHPNEAGAIDVKCETCTLTHYSFQHYVSPVKEKVSQ
jgi:hypothetical protein